MANIIQLATYRYCLRFLDNRNDPGGRMFSQMTQAARSCPANIAEGMSRNQTSHETVMRLLDTARATLSELLQDFTFIANLNGVEIWHRTQPEASQISGIKLDRPNYTDDWIYDSQKHLLSQYAKFQKDVESDNLNVATNSMIALCVRNQIMLQRLIEAQLAKFRAEGGFTENLTRERLSSRAKAEALCGAPACPQCGAPMVLRTIQRGIHIGRKFWGCTFYPRCNGTQPYMEPPAQTPPQ